MSTSTHPDKIESATEEFGLTHQFEKELIRIINTEGNACIDTPEYWLIFEKLNNMDKRGEGEYPAADLRVALVDLREGPSTSASAISNSNATLSEAMESAVAVEEQFGLTQLFQNELIADMIVEFLNFSDMKAVREVSSGLNRAIRKNRRFMEKAMLRICKETVALKRFLVDSSQPWKSLQIHASLPIKVIKMISHMLPSVKALQIVMDIDPAYPQVNTGNRKNLAKFLTLLFTNLPSLTTLLMEYEVMKKTLVSVFSDSRVQEQLSKIKCLEIKDRTPKTQYMTDRMYRGPHPTNMLLLSSIPFALETFKMANTYTIIRMLSGNEHMKFIPKIVSSNQDTLIELSLHMKIWRDENMKKIRCPALKRLTISAYQKDAAGVIAFLKNQPLLEELSVNMWFDFSSVVLLLSVIQGKGSKLKKLHLKLHTVSGISISGPIDWRLLAGFQSLTDFSISVHVCPCPHGTVHLYGTGVTFLKHLPHQLKKLRLKGLQKFWWDRTPAGLSVGPISVPQRIELLQPFKSLTEFSLMRCEDTFTDEILQYVFKEFDKLRVFSLSDCSGLTDFGLTGKRTIYEGVYEIENTGISLNNLKGLRKLKIRRCSLISNDGMLDAVALPYLQSLKYWSIVRVSKKFVLSIAQQNPSLESFSVLVSQGGSVKKKDLKKVNRRLNKFYPLMYYSRDFDWDSDEERELETDDDDSYDEFLGGVFVHIF